MWYSNGMKKKLKLNPQQQQELEELTRHGVVPHERIKALAVYNAVRGLSYEEVARLLCVERRSVGRWVRNYLAQGVTAFSIKPGRGRRSRINGEEVEYYVRQSPTQFGVSQTRWTLALLGRTVPSLRGMTWEGIRKALGRLGYSYKRGQPSVHSPDPRYGEKRGLWCKP